MRFLSPNGLLRHLVSGGQSSKIRLEVSCNESSSRPPSLIITYPNTDHWASCRDSSFSQYIQVELIGMTFNIESYSYENLGADAYNINWDFLGSADGKGWTTLDSRKNDYILKENKVTVLPAKRGRYRFFRIKQTGINYYFNTNTDDTRRYILYVRNLDLFGSIGHDSTCNTRTKTFLWYNSLIAFIFSK